ncbi:MAG: hypothetical protein ACD_20C00395G0001 [uncultured bacterium]|nr:MAG: hypothetical protein ACD_20C00395G0001 [uncultured bacterium]
MRIIKKSFPQVNHSKTRIIELFAQIYLNIFLTNFPIGKILLKSYLVKTKDKKLKNYTLIRLIEQSIKQYKLDLSSHNILMPVYSSEPALMPVLASLAGAKNVYVTTRELDAINRTAFYENQLELTSTINFIEKESPQTLSGLDIVLVGEGVSYIDSKFVSALKKECIISILPQNLDFNQASGVNIEECVKKKIPVVAVDPNDHNLQLYRQLAHMVVKRCCENNIDILKSRLLLISNGSLADNILSHLKSCGAQVYCANTDKPQDRSYILKHLPEVDAVIVADYPLKSTLVVGNEGFIRIEDILNINPEIKIIHLAGKMQANSLTANRIYYKPENLIQNSLNVNIKEMGLRAAIEIATASMKIAESLIKIKNRTILPNDSVVTYNIINADGPVVLGRVNF